MTEGSLLRTPIPVTQVCLQLDGKSAKGPDSISRTCFSSNCGEPNGGRYFLVQTLRLEREGNGVIGEVLRRYEVAVRTSPLCVENMLWNTFTVEVTEVVKESDVCPGRKSQLEENVEVGNLPCKS